MAKSRKARAASTGVERRVGSNESKASAAAAKGAEPSRSCHAASASVGMFHWMRFMKTVPRPHDAAAARIHAVPTGPELTAPKLSCMRSARPPMPSARAAARRRVNGSPSRTMPKTDAQSGMVNPITAVRPESMSSSPNAVPRCHMVTLRNAVAASGSARPLGTLSD